MKLVYVSFLLLFFGSCGGPQTGNAQQMKEEPLSFKMVEIPSILTDPMERADYLVSHYWDQFDFANREYAEKPEITEQAFVDYIDILPYVPYDKASASISKMMKSAQADTVVFSYFGELSEKYLHDPNSPMRNEEYYIPVLEVLVVSPLLDEVAKIRPQHRLEIALRNRVGQEATDFTYTLANGTKGKMHAVKANYTLLYFYNPDCNSCKQITADLRNSPVVQARLQAGDLKVLAVYTDEDKVAWKAHLGEIPEEWINSYDETTILKDEEIYDLKAIPTLYLLDKEKKVILKDTTFETVHSYLQQF